MKLGKFVCGLMTLATVSGSTNVVAEDQTQPLKHHYLLSINMAPAACVLHPENREKRQCQEGYALIVHGLWTEKPASPKAESPCTEKQPDLSPVQQRVLEKLMPDPDMRVRAWQKYGACTGLSAQEYFRAITSYTNKLKLPDIFREEGNDRQVDRDELVAAIQKLNATLPDKALYLRCQSKQDKTFLTEVRVCYNREGQFAECTNFKPNCPTAITLRAIK